VRRHTKSTTKSGSSHRIVAELRAHPARPVELESFAQKQQPYAEWADRVRASRLAEPEGGAAFVDTTTLRLRQTRAAHATRPKPNRPRSRPRPASTRGRARPTQATQMGDILASPTRAPGGRERSPRDDQLESDQTGGNMTVKRIKRIIAVFGGSKDADVLACAEELGRTIAEENQILLTGGTRPARDAVKNSAICGAGSSPWVGVDRASPGNTDWSTAPEPGFGFLVRSDLDHKRNYLEACMCDAAIGLQGGIGTESRRTVRSTSLSRLPGTCWPRVDPLHRKDVGRPRRRRLTCASRV
jgi:hypothetical protein